MRFIIYGCLCLLFFQQMGHAQKNKGSKNGPEGIFKDQIPAHPFDIILSRPTKSSISISVMSQEDGQGQIRYGLDSNQLNNITPVLNLVKGIPGVFEIAGLKSDSKYYYRFFQHQKNTNASISETNHFKTQTAFNKPFQFTIQADSHLDENTEPNLYLKTLENMASDAPDFLVDLGDTWMTDKHHPDYTSSLNQYLAQRYYFGTLCKSSSLFLTLGNHDGEGSPKQNNTAAISKWSTATRKKYYFNPEPNGFYTGNQQKEDQLGMTQDYYAWEWGNALFVVLDPFRFTLGNKDPWQRTLGDQQYQWLKTTLQNSKAVFKFVFIHNLVGGVDLKGRGRGGAEASQYYEWGGADTTGQNQFSKYRPGWEKPIHDLLLQYKVQAVFHGHDHFFAKQERDGLVYQLVPQPGSFKYGNNNQAAEYGYQSGKLLQAPGYLRVRLENNQAMVDFIQTSIDARHKNKEILYTYTLKAN